jgi:hypothetical protein
MSEQTDPLAALLRRLPTWVEGDPRDNAARRADAIRAAVLADPTIVGMERVWECVDAYDPEPGTRICTPAKPHHGCDWSRLYRTPEVKG